jgi:hypothetical protein
MMVRDASVVKRSGAWSALRCFKKSLSRRLPPQRQNITAPLFTLCYSAMSVALASSCYFVHCVLVSPVAWSCMDKKERIKLTQDQRDAIDEYNTGVSPDKKVNKHYSAARAQWLNENIFEPSGVELAPLPPPQKLKKAQWDAQRSSQPTTSTHSMSKPRVSAYEDDEDITFTVPRYTFADPIKDIITDELKAGNKKLLKEVDARLEKFGAELSSSITKSIAAMLVSILYKDITTQAIYHSLYVITGAGQE